MDPLSSSSPRRDDAEQQDELREIASQMELETQADVDVRSAMDESESGDDDGPRVGQGAWVNGRWVDHLIHAQFRKENIFQWMRLIRITNRNNW
jgi:hypothetical protein